MLMKRKSADEQNESVHEFKTPKTTNKNKDGANEKSDWDNLPYPIILTIAKSGLANNFPGL